MSTTTIKIDKNPTIGIQSGEVTHHQDQSILLVSFNIRNTKNRTVVIPIPPLVD
jgi:hypothetical protein